MGILLHLIMRFFALVAVFLISLSALGQTMTLEGSYEGKDLFVRNVYDKVRKEFCVNEVLVNGVSQSKDPKMTALHISLADVGFGKPVEVVIYHKTTCKPIILNPEVLKLKRGFQFLNVVVTNNSIDILAKGEARFGSYIVEKQYEDENVQTYWEEVYTFQAKGNVELNRYSVPTFHEILDNTYRIIYKPLENEPVISEPVVYTVTSNPISFYPTSVTTKITFSEPTEYEIFDMNGRSIKQGRGDEVFLQELKPGEYFVKFQNRYERFVKK